MPERAPAVIIIHGIAGSKDSLCCVRAAVALHRAGYHAVRLDMRAAGESVVDAPSLYHGGLTTDVELTVRYLLQDARVSSVYVLGFSGGGSIALKLAGEWGAAAPPGVTAIASISAPLDYLNVGARMDSRRSYIYRRHVLGGLIDRARAFAQMHPERAHYKPEELAPLNRFRTYDAHVIVPMHGFRDVDHYYREVSSGPYLPKIALPTMLIHAEDDPMVPMRGVDIWLKHRSPNVQVALTRHGGHIGWIGGTDEASWINGWALQQALDFFNAQKER
jgi:predicted alpha/beta-fold hydrolase